MWKKGKNYKTVDYYVGRPKEQNNINMLLWI